jgi:hypothetical protein
VLTHTPQIRLQSAAAYAGTLICSCCMQRYGVGTVAIDFQHSCSAPPDTEAPQACCSTSMSPDAQFNLTPSSYPHFTHNATTAHHLRLQARRVCPRLAAFALDHQVPVIHLSAARTLHNVRVFKLRVIRRGASRLSVACVAASLAVCSQRYTICICAYSDTAVSPSVVDACKRMCSSSSIVGYATTMC